MKKKTKSTFSIISALTILVFIFYSGRLSLQVDRELAGFKYDILLNGNTTQGTIGSDGVIWLPWNPFRKSGLATIEFRKADVKHYSGLNISPSFGRHILYSDSSIWEYGHRLYIFGVPIREVQTRSISDDTTEIKN